MSIPLNIHLYEPGLAGIPGGNYIGDYGGRAESYTHSIVDQGGFESMTVSFKGTMYEALNWLQNGLGRSVEVCNPDAFRVWEGQLVGVSARVGQKSASVSLDAMCNRVRCVFTTTLGTPGTTVAVSSTGSQGIYGVKDRVVSLPASDQTSATNKANIVLAAYAYPKSNEATQAMTGAIGDITITLNFAGWYTTLGWLITSNTTTSTAVTTTQVGTLLTTAAATNAFIDTSTANITPVSNVSPQFIAASTTIREAIEARLNQGDGTNPIAWGVYEKRQFYVTPWAGATPTVITYQEFAGDARIYNLGRAVVQPWDVRPNANSQVVDLMDVGPVSGATDSASRKYVGRVTCTIQGGQIGCTLEPPSWAPVDARLALLT